MREVAEPKVRRGALIVRMKAVPLLSYLDKYVEGQLPYMYPEIPFTPGTNGVGEIVAVGDGVSQYRVGQRVALSPHFVVAENSDEAPQILIGLTGMGPNSASTLRDWPDGTLREQALMPASVAVSLDGLENISFDRLATLGKFSVPLGGLIRGRLAAGETVIISGATGYFGSGAVLLALALGAARVVISGRHQEALEAIARHDKSRIVPVVLSGDVPRDAEQLREAAGGGAELAFDMVGRATDPNSTLSALHALKRFGRLVLMGSMTVPLPLPYAELLQQNKEVIGNFMYRPEDYRRLVKLVRAGQLDLGKVNVQSFPLADIPTAMKAAGKMRGLDCTVVTL